MGHSNGHAADFIPETTSTSDWSRKDPAEEDILHIPPEEAGNGKGQETFHENYGESLPKEWELISKLAVKHLRRCVSLEPKVLQGDDPDAIHDLRVATRRLQQVMNLLYPSPHSGEMRKLHRSLRRCRRSLSEVRNYDVLLKRVEATLARKRTARREAWEAIREYLVGLRAPRLEKSLRKLAKANLSDIYVRLKELLPANGNSGLAAEISSRDSAGQALSREQFYERISGALRSVWAELEQEVAQSRHDHSPSFLHRTRIAVKRVRYLIEVIQAFDIPGSKETLIWLRSLQTQLGDWHDLVVFEEAVLAMIADGDFLRDHLELAIQIERLIMRNRALKTRLETKYFDMVQDRAGFVKHREWVRRMADSPSALFARS